MNKKIIKEGAAVQLPAMMIPSFRTALAIQDGCQKNLLFRTWGGLGDQICAEPTLRFALNKFRDCSISLASQNPEFFRHLTFNHVYDLRKETPDYSKHLLFDTIVPPDHLTWEFFSHMITHCVDFPSLCAIRCQLPIDYKEVILQADKPKESHGVARRDIFVHPGKHWPSKTFPKDWWDAVLYRIITCGFRPVIIGADADDNRSTVDVDTEGCLDLRNKLSLNDTLYYLQKARVLLTNDSMPLHMAVTGDAYIGFIATCKHPDYITHWRNGVWGWRMKNFGLGGIWDATDYCPNKSDTVTVDKVEPGLLRSWLPNPNDFASWAVERAIE